MGCEHLAPGHCMTSRTPYHLCCLVVQGLSAWATPAVGVPGFILHCLGSLVASSREISVTGRDIDMSPCKAVQVIKMGGVERLDL